MSVTTALQLVFYASFGMIAYTYLIFPLLLAACCRFNGRTKSCSAEPADDDSLPTVAMLIAAHDEEAVLRAKLANIRETDYPASRFEVLIGSDGSTDGTDAIMKSSDDAHLRYFPFAERRGKISVLNDLVQNTDAEIVVMSDANTMFEPDAVRKLVRHFQDPRVGCVSGELALEQGGGVSGEGLYWKYEGWIKRNEGRLGYLIGCNGGIYAMRRALYNNPPTSTIIDDFVLSMRVIEQGHEVHFDPEARATEPPCASSRSEMVRKIRIGAGGWQALGLTRPLLHPRHGVCAFAFWGHKVLRWTVPHFYLLMLAANIALVGNPVFRALLAVQATCALVAIITYWAGPTRKLPKWTRPISYFYLMNYALGRGFMRYLFGTQKVTWERGVGVPTEISSSFACSVPSVHKP